MVCGCYLHYHDLNDPSWKKNGIDYKVQDQVRAFNDAGIGCEFVYCPQPETTGKMVASCLPGLGDGVTWPSVDRFREKDFLYIRRPRFASRELISFLRDLKSVHPDIFILYEVPSYPYDEEMNNPKQYLALRKDRRHRRELSKYVDAVVDLTHQEEIFGVPTIQCFNGIDLSRTKVRDPQPDPRDELRIVCAAYFTPTHGIDRMIEGLNDYYNKRSGIRNVILDLAGTGDPLRRIARRVRDYHLEDHVLFHGALDRGELDDLYDECTMAVGILGLYRIDATMTSALKTREYLAKGIPFVYAGDVDVFEKNPADFCLQIPNDDSPVNIEDMIRFHDELYGARPQEDVVAEIRRYAEEAISMKQAMADVIERLKRLDKNSK